MQRLQLALCCSLAAHAIIFFYWPALEKPSNTVRPTLQLILQATTAENVATTSQPVPASGSEQTLGPQSKQPQPASVPQQQPIVRRQPEPTTQHAKTPLNRQLPKDLDFEQPAASNIFDPRLRQALQQQRQERAITNSYTADHQPKRPGPAGR